MITDLVQCNYAHYTSNWFYTYQVYCSMPSTFKLTWLGYICLILITTLILTLLFYLYVKYFYVWKGDIK